MSRSLTVEVSEETYAVLQRQAEATGMSAAEIAASAVENQLQVADAAKSAMDRQAARERFERHFGEIELDPPTRVDNDSIDSDLAAEYHSSPAER
jgi:predicted transcriptional regulator